MFDQWKNRSWELQKNKTVIDRVCVFSGTRFEDSTTVITNHHLNTHLSHLLTEATFWPMFWTYVALTLAAFVILLGFSSLFIYRYIRDGRSKKQMGFVVFILIWFACFIRILYFAIDPHGVCCFCCFFFFCQLGRFCLIWFRYTRSSTDLQKKSFSWFHWHWCNYRHCL
jgi:hypothetical protein